MQKVDASLISSGSTLEGAHVISAMRFKFRDEFTWPAQELYERYKVVEQDGGSVVPSPASGQLTLSSGVNATGKASIELKLPFATAVRLFAGLRFNTTLPANCNVFLELIPEGRDAPAIAYHFPAGSTNVQCRILSFTEDGLAAWENTNAWYPIADRTANTQLFEIQGYPDEWRFNLRPIQSLNGRATLAVRNTRIPDSDTRFTIRLRMENSGVVASAAQVAIHALCVNDLHELPVDLTNTGGGSLSESLPVNVVAIPSVASVPTVSATNGSYASAFQRVSDATINAVNVRNAAVNLGGGGVANGTAAPLFLKLYNLNRVPVPATDVPFLTILCPVGVTTPLAPYIPDLGLRLTSGLSMALTKGLANTDAVAADAGAIVQLLTN